MTLWVAEMPGAGRSHRGKEHVALAASVFLARSVSTRQEQCVQIAKQQYVMFTLPTTFHLIKTSISTSTPHTFNLR